MSHASTRDDERRGPPLVVTLLVVALAAGAALATALTWAARHDRERQDAAQRESASRLASVVRLLLEQRIERGRSTLRAIASSGEVREALGDLSQAGLLKALAPFADEFGATALVVRGTDGRLLAWSSPLAIITLGAEDDIVEGSAGEPAWKMIGGDLALVIDQPVEAHGRTIGWVRGAIFAGRFFVTQATEDLNGIPVALAFEGEVVHHTFSEAPVLPRLSADGGEEPGSGVALGRVVLGGDRGFDVAVRPLDLGGGRVAIAAGVPRGTVEAAARRYALLLAAIGAGALLVTLTIVGGYLFLAQQRARLILQRDTERMRSRGLHDRLEHVTAVVHDAKAPISGIQLLSEALLEDHADGPMRGPLERIVEACEKLNLYLVNVLTAARAEDGSLAASFAPVLVPGLLEDVVERVAPQAKRHRVAVVTECAEDVSALEADALLLERALVNLASNALAVAPERSTMTIFARTEGEALHLGVEDEGPGFVAFPPEEAFARDRPRPKDASLRSGSTGFGLYIVGKIAALHGGRALASHRPQGGARVSLVIPARRNR